MGAAKANEKQFRFADEYLTDFNGKQAAIRAGYAPAHASRRAFELLRKPHIMAYLAVKRRELANKLNISKERTMLEIGRLAFSDIRKFFADDGTLKDVHLLDDDSAAAVSSVESDETFESIGESRVWTGYAKKVKLWDKVRALEMLAKHYKILEVDEDGGIKLSVTIKKSAPDAAGKH